MPILGNKKNVLLGQIDKQQTQVSVAQLVKLVSTYDDLEKEDFRGHISEDLYAQLVDALRDPNEKALWDRITSAEHSSPETIQALQRLVSQYIQQYPNGSRIAEARDKQVSLQTELANAMQAKRQEQEKLREQADWDNLDKGNYNSLLTYRSKYPQSVHLDEIDDYMWTNVKNAVNIHSLSRYVADWPMGRHAAEANKAISSFDEWEKVKRSGDIFQVDDYRDNHPDSPFIGEVSSLYYQLRDKELQNMKANPSDYSKDDVDRLIEAGIFSQWELLDENLITEDSCETLQMDRSLFPNIQDYQQDANIVASDNCTDIYLFGTPGTGKTCLLMGLTGANGKGYVLNMKTAGGPYASALQQYVNNGITPGHTFGNFVTTINGQVFDEDKQKNARYHKINFVEMSGEEFALRIADNQSVSLADMGTGVTTLMQNSNRKVFFIIVDPTKDRVKVEYLESVKDEQGTIIDQRIRKKYNYQLDILNKFVSLFELPENQEIMKNVDAIHFIVTKADTLGTGTDRLTKARELLTTKYAGPVESLKAYCRQTKRINYAANKNYSPHVFTFSLGKFYLGDVFQFDATETLQIISAIRSITGFVKEKSWLDKLREALN
jgi:hypothetical protein